MIWGRCVNYWYHVGDAGDNKVKVGEVFKPHNNITGWRFRVRDDNKRGSRGVESYSSDYLSNYNLGVNEDENYDADNM